MKQIVISTTALSSSMTVYFLRFALSPRPSWSNYQTIFAHMWACQILELWWKFWKDTALYQKKIFWTTWCKCALRLPLRWHVEDLSCALFRMWQLLGLVLFDALKRVFRPERQKVETPLNGEMSRNWAVYSDFIASTFSFYIYFLFRQRMRGKKLFSIGPLKVAEWRGQKSREQRFGQRETEWKGSEGEKSVGELGETIWGQVSRAAHTSRFESFNSLSPLITSALPSVCTWDFFFCVRSLLSLFYLLHQEHLNSASVAEHHWTVWKVPAAEKEGLTTDACSHRHRGRRSCVVGGCHVTFWKLRVLLFDLTPSCLPLFESCNVFFGRFGTIMWHSGNISLLNLKNFCNEALIEIRMNHFFFPHTASASSQWSSKQLSECS